MSRIHDVRTVADQYVTSFDGNVPRVGEYIEHMAKWFKVERVKWSVHAGGEIRATVIVDLTGDLA